LIGGMAVFGIELTQVVARKTILRLIPPIVEKTIIFLSRFGAQHTLFITPGNPTMIGYYRYQFDQGLDVEFSHYTDPHTVAHLLLSYLDELPIPLLCFDAYDRWIELAQHKNEQLITEIKNIVESLPEAHRAVLCFTLAFLDGRLQASEEKSKLELAYAKVFGPVLLKPPKERVPDANLRPPNEMQSAIRVAEYLIEYQNLIFSGMKEGTLVRRLKVKHSVQRGMPKFEPSPQSTPSHSRKPSEIELHSRKQSELDVDTDLVQEVSTMKRSFSNDPSDTTIPNTEKDLKVEIAQSTSGFMKQREKTIAKVEAAKDHIEKKYLTLSQELHGSQKKPTEKKLRAS